jgi:hypothetical protein
VFFAAVHNCSSNTAETRCFATLAANRLSSKGFDIVLVSTRHCFEAESASFLVTRRDGARPLKWKLVRRDVVTGGYSSVKPRPWDKTVPSNNFGPPVEVLLKQLQARVDELEGFLRAKFPTAFEAYRNRDPETASRNRTRGPSPRVPDSHLVIRRNWLIKLLEQHWPELQPMLRKHSKERLSRSSAKAFLKRVADEQGSLASPAAKLLENFHVLVSFLQSSDYNEDPRRIANAMAGVPEYSCSTSLKHCRANPSDEAIGPRALRDYLKRRYRSVFVELQKTRDVVKIQEIMDSVETNDREYNWLRDDPEGVLEIMRLGLPTEIDASGI